MDTSQSGHPLEQQAFARPFECQWNFCRLTFPTRDALNHHLLVDHIRRSVPVRLRDIPLLERAEQGLGSSFELTPLLRVPTASASTSSQSTDPQPSGEHFASTSQLPSPPTSSPFVQSMELAECERPRHITPAQLHDHDPSFLSLVSPGSTAPSIQVPPSPSLSTLVYAHMKRKGGPGSPEEPPLKRVRQDDVSQPTSSFDSNASHNVVESELTQGLSDEDDSDYEPNGREDSGSSSEGSSDEEEDEEQQTAGGATLSQDSQSQISDTLAMTQEKSDLYKAELNWPASQVEPSQLSQDFSSLPSTQPQIVLQVDAFSSSQDAAPQMPQLPPTSPTATQPQRPLHIHESLSQPPSQLALPTHPPHTQASRAPTPTPEPTQTGANSSMSLPVNSPIALAPPAFAASTPTRQTWYQCSHLQRRSSKTFTGGSSGEITPKGSPLQTPTAVSFMQSPLSQVRPQASQASQKSPQKKPTFHSGNLAAARSLMHTPKKDKATVAASPITPKTNAQPANDPPSHPAPTTDLANEATAVALMQQILDVRDESSAVWSESQSQGFPSTQLTNDLERSYPELQTQAPYRSPSLSQLD